MKKVVSSRIKSQRYHQRVIGSRERGISEEEFEKAPSVFQSQNLELKLRTYVVRGTSSQNNSSLRSPNVVWSVTDCKKFEIVSSQFYSFHKQFSCTGVLQRHLEAYHLTVSDLYVSKARVWKRLSEGLEKQPIK